MVHASASRPAPRRAAAAFHRRLSRRDVRDLARLTAALKVAGAPAFERHGVVVHLVHPSSFVDFERAVDVQAVQGGPAQAADGGCVRPAREPTPRQQKRRERGQQLAQRRKNKQKQQMQHLSEQHQQQQPHEEQQPEQGGSSPIGISLTEPAAPLDVPEIAAAPTPAAVAGSQLHDNMDVSPPRPNLVPRVLQLRQVTSTAMGKRESPATPSRASVADSSSPGSAPRPGPKRLALDGHTL